MRIRVASSKASADEKRAYAEYRLFAAIAQYETCIRAVDVAVERDPSARGYFVCTVVVELRDAGQVKARARAGQATAAIDRAAERTAWLVGRRVRQDFRTKSPALNEMFHSD
jgi:ribosome-associated translation inhibitor RaiA